MGAGQQLLHSNFAKLYYKRERERGREENFFPTWEEGGREERKEKKGHSRIRPFVMRGEREEEEKATLFRVGGGGGAPFPLWPLSGEKRKKKERRRRRRRKRRRRRRRRRRRSRRRRMWRA